MGQNYSSGRNVSKAIIRLLDHLRDAENRLKPENSE